jgi:hypothetical protein
MKSPNRFTITVTMLAITILAGCAFSKKLPKIGTHFLALDLDKKDWKAYDSSKDVQVWVLGPEGIEPGVILEESTDGTKVLVVPPEIAEQELAPTPPDTPGVPKDTPKATPQAVVPPSEDPRYGESLL